jgi:hypothetical protein
MIKYYLIWPWVWVLDVLIALSGSQTYEQSRIITRQKFRLLKIKYSEELKGLHTGDRHLIKDV